MKRGRRISSIPKQQVLAEKLYMKGMKIPFIAISAGVSVMTLYRWARKYGWEKEYALQYETQMLKILSQPVESWYLPFPRKPTKLKDVLKKS